MQLTPQQQALLDGAQGETMAKVVKTLVMYGDTFGAQRMVPVTSEYGHTVISFGLAVMKPVYDLYDRLIESGLTSGQKFTADPLPLDKHVPTSLLEDIVFRKIMYTQQDRYERQLKKLGIPFEAHVYSAHRTPAEAAAFAASARESGFGVLIAAAGKAAHLAGALAAQTTLPVIGIPVKSSTLDGLDALLSTVQMPSGMPVAAVAIDGAANAALLAAQILAVEDEALAEKLLAMRRAQHDAVIAKDAALIVE